MLFHGERCRHCGGNMSQPKLITDGPKRGGSRTICMKCGHIEYHAGQDMLSPSQRPPPPQPGGTSGNLLRLRTPPRQ